MTIEKKDYDLIGILNDEEDMLDSFSDYSGYVCDVIHELADNYIPVYYDDIWENARDISEYIDDAIAEGLTEGLADINKVLQYGYDRYYSQSLYNNLDIISFNMVADIINEYLDSQDNIKDIDLEEIESAIEEEVEDFDHNNQTTAFNDIAQLIIQKIEAEEFKLEED